jgi:regulator of sigma E protease
MSILLAILLFGVLIFVHELGHFLFAKLCNVKVLKFSIGFGPKLIGRKIGETEYVISALPLGGYVKMYGEDPDEEIIEEDRARSYKRQPLRKRAMILLAGPVFNILLTFVIYTSLLAIGSEVPVPELKNLMPVVDEVVAGAPAAKAGLKNGDRIVSIGDTDINTWIDVVNLVWSNPGKEMVFVVKRGDSTHSLRITPGAETIKDRTGKDITVGRIGIKKSGQGIYSIVKSESPADVPVLGAYATYKMGILIYDSIWMTVSGEISVKNVGGPIAIVSLSNRAADAGIIAYLLFMALISVNLGILNLLPIPVLDGGHLLFMGIEAVRGKPLSDETMAFAQKTGLILLLALMGLVIFNDIFRLFSGKPW